MKNNKAQALVIFVIILPVLLLGMAYVFDIVRVSYEKNKLENLARIAYRELENEETSVVEETLRKNGFTGTISIQKDEDKRQVELEDKVPSLFGKLVGQKEYRINIVLNE